MGVLLTRVLPGCHLLCVQRQQIFDTAIGSPVSITVANMLMEHVEQRALSSCDCQPIF